MSISVDGLKSMWCPLGARVPPVEPNRRESRHLTPTKDSNKIRLQTKRFRHVLAVRTIVEKTEIDFQDDVYEFSQSVRIISVLNQNAKGHISSLIHTSNANFPCIYPAV